MSNIGSSYNTACGAVHMIDSSNVFDSALAGGA